jgi:integrase
MKTVDAEVVTERVSIARRVQSRKTAAGAVVEKVSSGYTAEYTDAGGKRRFESLKTTVKREARIRAMAIDARLGRGESRQVVSRLTIAELIDHYKSHCIERGLTQTSRDKYHADLCKLQAYCDLKGIVRADRFDEAAFVGFGAWLRESKSKQGLPFADKTRAGALVLVKQTFKYAWKSNLLGEFKIAGAKLPTARARPQPCFTTDQVEALLSATTGELQAGIATLAYAGLRAGELLQLRWEDARFDTGMRGMLHVRLGGSAGAPKDKDHRFIPISSRIAPMLKALPRTSERVFPNLNDRTLLATIKRLCRGLGYGTKYKIHSFRHHFASICANTAVPYRLCLKWLGHSSSEIADLYYHLSDAESEAAMQLVTQRLAERQAQR